MAAFLALNGSGTNDVSGTTLTGVVERPLRQLPNIGDVVSLIGSAESDFPQPTLEDKLDPSLRFRRRFFSALARLMHVALK
jgi:hypothetical protein